MRTSSVLMSVLSTLVLLTATGTDGQSPCSVALVEGLKAYEIGRFDQVTELLSECSHGGLQATRREQVEALRLVAMAWIGADHPLRAERAVQTLLELKPNFEATLRDPLRFARMIDQTKLAGANQQVTSVSKKSESILLAPATVQLISEEDIRNRGYADLEALLHDLPGFDISRGNGVLYSNIYQRGYRSNGTDRTLFLIDGVEENDLWSNFANISRQYPLSNIKRVEVVYGPASTMYGPNAYAGVVNLITKTPGELIDRSRSLDLLVQTGGGSLATRYADITLSGRTEGLAVSVTGRVFHSDEADLSEFDSWDYEAHGPQFYLDKLSIRDPDLAQRFLETDPVARDHIYARVIRAGDTVEAIELTEQGALAAAAYDSAALRQQVNGAPVGYRNATRNWMIYGKMRLGDLLFGAQTWRRNEGSIGWFPDDREASTQNGGVWIPRHTFFYVRYDRNLNDALSLSSFTRVKIHSVDQDNRIVIHRSYAGEGRLSLSDLLKDNPSHWSTLYFHRLSRELRIEFKAVYAPTAPFSVVSGIEFRRSWVQGEYTVSTLPNPTETGFPFDQLNEYDQLDVGAYGQATYHPRDALKVVLGGRLDYNRVRATLGYGTVFNPRAALVWHPGGWVLKAIYAEAFKAASNSAKFSTSPSRLLTSPDLEPEKVRNVDLSISRKIRERTTLEAVAYRSNYSDVIGAVEVTLQDGSSTTQNRPIGALRIQGLMLSGNYRGRHLALNGNYSYTDPQNTEARDSSGNIILGADGGAVKRRIGDIASHRVNLSASVAFARQLNLALRFNYVSSRRTGDGTTVPNNPFDRIEAYTTIGGALTWRGALPGAEAQLAVENLLDKAFFHPGVRSAEDAIHVARLPQNGRTAYLRLRFDL